MLKMYVYSTKFINKYENIVSFFNKIYLYMNNNCLIIKVIGLTYIIIRTYHVEVRRKEKHHGLY